MLHVCVCVCLCLCLCGGHFVETEANVMDVPRIKCVWLGACGVCQ